MLRPQNDLAAELDAAYQQHLLEKGNLEKPRSNWVDENRWTSLGYTAHRQVNTCNACGAVSKLFTGFYHRESTPSGAVRELALHAKAQIPLSSPVTVFTTKTAYTCPDCLLGSFTALTYAD
jgi:hypothetical protein